MMPGELVLNEDYSGGVAKVFVRGEIDIYTARQFKEKLYDVVDGSDKDVVIDFRELNYIDSTGLGIIVGALKKAKLNGRSVRIINPRDSIKKLFVITGLDKLFMI